MLDTIQQVRALAPNARLDCCPYDGDSNKTAYFIRLGPGGPWLSNARRSARAAWGNAATRITSTPTDESNQPRLNMPPPGPGH